MSSMKYRNSHGSILPIRSATYSGVLLVFLAAVSLCPGAKYSTNAPSLSIVRVNPAGAVFWNNQLMDTNMLNENLAQAGVDGQAIALYGNLPDDSTGLVEKDVFEKMVKAGVPILIIKENAAPNMAPPPSGQEPQPTLALSTDQMRKVFDLLNSLNGEKPGESQPLAADIRLRINPEDSQGYMLRRIEIGLAGKSVWIVYENKSDVETSTTIQLQKDW